MKLNKYLNQLISMAIIKRLHVIAKKLNVLNFIVIVLESIKLVKAVIVWAVIIQNNMQIKEVMQFQFLWIEILILSVLKQKQINIQKAVIVKNQIVLKNIVNVIKQDSDVDKIVNVNSVRTIMINRYHNNKKSLFQLNIVNNKENKFKIDKKYLL